MSECMNEGKKGEVYLAHPEAKQDMQTQLPKKCDGEVAALMGKVGSSLIRSLTQHLLIDDAGASGGLSPRWEEDTRAQAPPLGQDWGKARSPEMG